MATSIFPEISTHSLTRRLTHIYRRLSMRNCISTHSLTRRLTSCGTWEGSHKQNFNSQPHKEADDKTVVQFKESENFNSQPHKEADNRNRGDGTED